MSKIEDALRKFRDEQRALGTESADAATGGMPRRRDEGDIARLEPGRRWSAEELEARALVDFSKANRKVANAFRQLRTTLLQKTAHSNFVLAITGVGSRSGTSFVARNLASAFALDPTKTAVLVDCNPSSRQMPQLTLGDPTAGLVDFLLDQEIDVEDIIHSTGVPRLRVIPTGRDVSGGGELYTTPRVEELLKQLRYRYSDRFTLLDIPPITESADSGILTQICDYVLLVIPYGRVSEAQINEAMDAIGPDRLIGIVFNNDPVWPY